MSQEEKLPLPEAFQLRMQEMLGEEYPAFLQSYDEKRWYGLRYNPLKTNKETFLNKMPFLLEKVEWAEEGYYYKEEEQPGKHAFHEAGVYYIQEPSAMAVADILAPKPGERILDLCAAPGGKSTQLAGKMQGEGILISNEIIPARAQILSQNIERMGVSNAVVCNETPDRLAQLFSVYFDKILVDAPCSGEGMFRKDDTAIKEWSPEHVKMCADRQQMILHEAVKMLKPGGVLVYSTCTFAEAENEETIELFLTKHPEMELEQMMRLWPHKVKGEGHFVARLHKKDGLWSDCHCSVAEETAGGRNKKEKNKKKKNRIDQRGLDGKTDGILLCQEFLQKELGISEEKCRQMEEKAVYLLFGEQVYLVPKEMIPLQGIKIVRPGLHLGTVKKNRFEPSHALALYLKAEETILHYEMTEEETACYLRGETFACDSALKGWVLLTTQGYSIGFGKAGGGQMKNHYPKGLRKAY